jgi:hypothetical protein
MDECLEVRRQIAYRLNDEVLSQVWGAHHRLREIAEHASGESASVTPIAEGSLGDSVAQVAKLLASLAADIREFMSDLASPEPPAGFADLHKRLRQSLGFAPRQEVMVVVYGPIIAPEAVVDALGVLVEEALRVLGRAVVRGEGEARRGMARAVVFAEVTGVDLIVSIRSDPLVVEPPETGPLTLDFAERVLGWQGFLESIGGSASIKGVSKVGNELEFRVPIRWEASSTQTAE